MCQSVAQSLLLGRWSNRDGQAATNLPQPVAAAGAQHHAAWGSGVPGTQLRCAVAGLQAGRLQAGGVQVNWQEAKPVGQGVCKEQPFHTSSPTLFN